MSTITREFTKERLIEHLRTRIEHRKGLIASMHIDRGYRDYLKLELLSSEIALASLEAEAVGITDRSEIECLKRGEMANVMPPDYKGVDAGDEVYVYTAPPAPVSVPEPIKRNDADGWWMYKGRRVGGGCAEWYNRALDDCHAAMLQGSDRKPELTVWYGLMPETNGKTNWTATLHRKGQHPWEGITIDRSEYPDRVRYEADRMRHLIGELADEPDILAYDAEEHSGYVYPDNSPGIPDGWVACSERMPERGVDVLACTISPIGGFEEIETAQWHGGMKGEQPVFITSADAIEPTHWMPLPAAPQQEVKP
ncbi:TPA: DUF551 domain-containing protein [Enterobacter roggenkampii]|nr:DUF551 domain-containing protein [Enterobacter roggenkampii]